MLNTSDTEVTIIRVRQWALFLQVKVCENGSTKPKMHVSVELEEESVGKVKEKILKKLKNDQGNSYGYYKQIRLFRITGSELLDFETLEDLQNNDFLFYSFGKLPVMWI